MNTHTLTLNELTQRAVAALTREIGVAGTLRFLSQYRRGTGDYTAERRALLGEATLDELLAQAQQIDKKKHVYFRMQPSRSVAGARGV